MWTVVFLRKLLKEKEKFMFDVAYFKALELLLVSFICVKTRENWRNYNRREFSPNDNHILL